MKKLTNCLTRRRRIFNAEDTEVKEETEEFVNAGDTECEEKAGGIC
jgi:hypothetical protein